MKTLLHTINVIDDRLLYGSESGKSLAVLDEAMRTHDQLPLIESIRTKNDLIVSSLVHARAKYKAIAGTCYRPDSIIDLLAHEAITQQMVKDDPWNLIDDAIEIAHNIAVEVIKNPVNNRKTHPSIDNSGYLNAYLVPAGFIAYGKSFRKAFDIWYAAILTRSRAFVPAFIAGVIAHAWKAKRPTLLLLTVPLFIPIALLYILYRRLAGLYYKRHIARYDGPRQGFRRAALKAKRDGRVYGYGNFSYCIEEYFEDYLGKNPTGAVYHEMWSDKCHNEFLELDVTVGNKAGSTIRQLYKNWLKQSPNPWIKGAMASHIVCLSLLFRTQAASIQEDFLIALIESKTKHRDVPNPFRAWANKTMELIVRREEAWKNYRTAFFGLRSKDPKTMHETLSLTPTMMEGRLEVPVNIPPKTFALFKQRFEESIELSNDAEMIYRYWHMLYQFKDPDTQKWYDRAYEASPKRMNHTMIHL